MSLSKTAQSGEVRRRISQQSCTTLLALLLPTLRCSIVAFVSADPLFAGGRLLELPERRLGLQPVDQEFAGLEGGLAMRRADRDQHDAVARLQSSVAMHDQRRLERPAAAGLGFDLLQRFLGHAGIMLEREGDEPLAMQALAHVHLAHQAHEHRQPADALVALRQTVELGAGSEIGFLDAHGHGQPPVKGGKNATSRAPASQASTVAVRWSTTAPKAAPSPTASSCPAPPAPNPPPLSPTVFTSARGRTRSSVSPTRRLSP